MGRHFERRMLDADFAVPLTINGWFCHGADHDQRRQPQTTPLTIVCRTGNDIITGGSCCDHDQRRIRETIRSPVVPGADIPVRCAGEDTVSLRITANGAG